ncbi:MAG: T9SS type A sorting domain-containing protein, partial [Bacteroidetes bacterium]|nr:T9SS type A sorting domain-containing protein [Bacteroidota bacterium]
EITPGNSGSSSLTLSDIIFNEDILAKNYNGYVRKLYLQDLSISPMNKNLFVGDSALFTAAGGKPPYTYKVTNNSLASVSSAGMFKALRGGTVKLEVIDSLENSAFTNNLQIFDYNIFITDTTILAGPEFDLPIKITRSGAPNRVYSYEGKLNYSGSFFNVVGYNSIGTASENFGIGFHADESTISFAGAGSAPMPDSDVLIYLRLKIKPEVTNNQYSYIRFANFMFNEGSPTALLGDGRIYATVIPPPDAPSELTAAALEIGKIELNWKDNSIDEEGFRIERKAENENSFSILTNVEADSTSFNDMSVQEGILYNYRIAAYKGNSFSNYSNTAQIQSLYSGILAPSNLSAASVSYKNVDLTWIDNSNNESGFIIERRNEPDTSFAVIDSVNVNQNSYDDIIVDEGSVYYYRVKAFNQFTESEYSGALMVETPFNTISWCSVDRPDSIFLSSIDTVTIFARVLVEEVTIIPGESPEIEAWIGYSTENSNPAAWTDSNWFAAEYNLDTNETDEYTASFRPEPGSNEYYFASRFTYREGEYFYGGYSESGGGFWDGTENISGVISIVVKNDESVQQPGSYTLYQNYPNPFNPSTLIIYEVPEKSFVEINVYDILGKKIKTLFSGVKGKGKYEVKFDAAGITGGTYIYTMKSEKYFEAKKCLLIK